MLVKEAARNALPPKRIREKNTNKVFVARLTHKKLRGLKGVKRKGRGERVGVCVVTRVVSKRERGGGEGEGRHNTCCPKNAPAQR